MQKLDGCVTSTAVNIDVIKSQIKENLKLNITNISDFPFFREGKSIALVGGGPSLGKYLPELRAFKGPVIACGSVHDFLVENDITFEYCVVCDPDPLIIKYMKEPILNTTYLIASQCHPSVFEHLKLDNIYIWHAAGDKYNNAELFGENVDVIGGGCTVGTRAIVLAMCLGYNNISLFGFDSSLSDNFKHHSYDFQTKEETIGNITEIKLGSPESTKTFYCADYMVGQLFDIKKLLEVYGARVKYDIRCDGALRYLFDSAIEMNKRNNISTEVK